MAKKRFTNCDKCSELDNCTDTPETCEVNSGVVLTKALVDRGKAKPIRELPRG
jgi:hypothetical protein